MGDDDLYSFLATSAERHAIKTQHQNFSESTQVIKPLTEEEKKQKLAELKARLAEKRAQDSQASIEEQKQAERLRRKAGQDMTSVKEQLEAKEMKKMVDAKKREKELDRIAKANIKAKIEQDKLERQAKVMQQCYRRGGSIVAQFLFLFFIFYFFMYSVKLANDQQLKKPPLLPLHLLLLLLHLPFAQSKPNTMKLVYK
jgi:Fe2+ transport system protein B